MAKAIMMQGTSSHVGKSILATALCRIFHQDGQRVVPFKAQNMALNSYVTPDGGEMGRAQVVQAEAAGLEPDVRMNPILLKPNGNMSSQIVVMGKPVENLSAQQYHQGFSLRAFGVVKKALRELGDAYDVMVIEGAGSPAEMNLKDNDIVNMRIAKLLAAPVLLVADIDRGGALASVVGTLVLLPPDERELVKGIVINKFRGDRQLLQPALDFLQEKTGKPVVGVIPYLEDIGIEDEDSVSLEQKQVQTVKEIQVAILKTPEISNFTDFDALGREPDVSVRYVGEGEAIGRCDLLILPGSKNTSADLLYLRSHGYEAEIAELVRQGIPVMGICGGFQMLGRELHDPAHVESDRDVTPGLGLFDAVTTFASDKITHQVTAKAENNSFIGMNYSGEYLKGYEIHMGRTDFAEAVFPAFYIQTRSRRPVTVQDGAVRADGLVMGTYIHGIFDNDGYRRAVVNALRSRKGLPAANGTLASARYKEEAYDRLADVVRRHLDMKFIYKTMQLEG